MSEKPYTQEQLQAAVEAITDPERLQAAQELVASALPDLQRILGEALEQGGWFGEAHQTLVLKAVGEPEIDERQTKVATLIAEETRLSMMVGVAVGYQLAQELSK